MAIELHDENNLPAGETSPEVPAKKAAKKTAPNGAVGYGAAQEVLAALAGDTEYRAQFMEALHKKG